MQRLDMNKVTEGVWVTYPEPNDDGSEFRVQLAMLGSANINYAKRLNAIVRPVRRKMELGTLSEEEGRTLYRKAFIEQILLNWEHCQPDDDGIELPFSKDNAEQFLSDLANATIYDWMIGEATLVEHFRVERRNNDLGN